MGSTIHLLDKINNSLLIELVQIGPFERVLNTSEKKTQRPAVHI